MEIYEFLKFLFLFCKDIPARIENFEHVNTKLFTIIQKKYISRQREELKFELTVSNGTSWISISNDLKSCYRGSDRVHDLFTFLLLKSEL